MTTLRTFAAALLAAAVACGPSTKPATTAGPPPDERPTDTQTVTQTPQAPTELPDVAFPDEPFRGEQPAAGEPRPFQLPGIKQFKLKNGIQVYLVEDHKLPTVQMQIVVPGGSANDPKGKAGAAAVCMAMVTEGTTKLDKLAFEAAQADLASNIGSYAGEDEQGVSMGSLKKNFAQTLDLWIDTVREPGFRQAELDRMIKRRKESLKQVRATAASVSRRVGTSIVWGADHPYALVETEASLDAITIADCKKHHRAYLKPKGAKLFVVGDMTEKEVRDTVGKRLAKWRGAPKRPKAPGKAKPRKGRIFFVDIPNAAQSQVSLRHTGPMRKAKDYFPTRLMARVLGGGFASRINMNLREDKGYAYGARGGFGYNRTGGTFALGASVQSDKTTESLAEMRTEFLAMYDGSKPPTAEELAREKNGDILSLPAGFATSSGVLGRYRSLIYFGLPMDYYENFVENIQSVTPEQVAAAAKAHLVPGKVQVFVVGDAGQALPGLYQYVVDGTFGAGDLVILDADGKVLETVNAEEAKKRLAK